jgi:NADPH:quinone reductase-like Zn-dependent oxidoreductase
MSHEHETYSAWEMNEPGPPSGLTRATRAIQALGPHEVLIRTRAVSLNYRDLLIITGRYLRKMSPHLVPCSDAAGDVVAIGSEVTSCAIGDRVMSTFAPDWRSGEFSGAAAKSALGQGETVGVLAERFVLPEHGVMRMPDSWSFEEASTLPCAALTAWHSLFEELPLPAGASVLTLGTGGVSIFAIQFALQAGARVIATSSRDDRLARLTQMGVGNTINYATVPAWGDRVRDLMKGTGVDRVIEVGGQGTLDQSIRAVRFGGMIALIGVLAKPAPVSLVPILMRNIRLQGIMVGSRDMFGRMLRTLATREIVPVIDRVFEFGEAPAAFDHLASGGHFGKIVIRA